MLQGFSLFFKLSGIHSFLFAPFCFIKRERLLLFNVLQGNLIHGNYHNEHND